MNIVIENFNENLQLIESIRNTLTEPIHLIGKLLAENLQSGGTIFWCGNGGSASDSQHLAAELVCRFKKNRRALRSIALNTDVSVLTSIANDYGYAEIFSRQIEALGRSGDCLIAISTSGNSENIIRALKAANNLGMRTVALLGKGGGDAVGIADHVLVVPSDNTARIQEAHILIGHIFCQLIEVELGIFSCVEY